MGTNDWAATIQREREGSTIALTGPHAHLGTGAENVAPRESEAPKTANTASLAAEHPVTVASANYVDQDGSHRV